MIVRELQTSYKRRTVEDDGITGRRITGPGDVARIMAAYPIEDGARLDCSHVERFYVLALDTKHAIRAIALLSIGTLDATIVHPRDVYRVALLVNAAAIIVAHNHPSGDPTPSPDDYAITERLRTAGDLLGVPCLDHIIVGHERRYFSHKQQGAASYADQQA